MDFDKGALVFTTFAVHLHSVTVAFEGFFCGNNKSCDDAVKAFLIIALLLFLVAFLLQVIKYFGEDLKLSKKIIGIMLFILLVIGVLSVLVAVGVYGAEARGHTPAYPTTTYVIGALCGVGAAILVLLSACK